ncbi:MAG: bifunctional diguanylate cyclase/phosphodiesterase [Gammaproteobacteria bacterium]|nr:bifunctional diguanylate cyclase/phosphodiesterase [Gammaproteobacteria bacterium]
MTHSQSYANLSLPIITFGNPVDPYMSISKFNSANYSYIKGYEKSDTITSAESVQWEDDLMIISGDHSKSTHEKNTANSNYVNLSMSELENIVVGFINATNPQALMIDIRGISQIEFTNMISTIRSFHGKQDLFLIAVKDVDDNSIAEELYAAGVSEVCSYIESSDTVFIKLNQGANAIRTLKAYLDKKNQLEQIGCLAKIGHWELFHDSYEMLWTSNIEELLLLEKSNHSNLALFSQSLKSVDQSLLASSLADCVEQKKSFTVVFELESSYNPVRKVKISGSPGKDNDKGIAVIGYVQDISNHNPDENSVRQLLSRDPTTGLETQYLFNVRIQSVIDAARRSQKSFSIIKVEIDSIDDISKHLNEEQLRELHIQTSARLHSMVRSRDIVSLLGKGTFGVLLPEIKDSYSAAYVAHKLLEAFSHPVQLEDELIQVNILMGIAVYPEDGLNKSTLFRSANKALNKTAALNKQYAYCSNSINDEAIARVELRQALNNALENHEFSVYYQPKLSMTKNCISGFEALLRWNRPGYGMVSPDVFVPIAEETGLIHELGRWVLDTACHQAADWHRQGLSVCMAVNASAMQLNKDTFINEVKHALKVSGLAAEYLEIEVTESDSQTSTEILTTLGAFRDMGVKIAIDDFGTGYSAFSSLKHLPADTLKIDRAFLGGIPENKLDSNLLESIIKIAKILKLSIVMEGVETQEQADFVIDKGCDHIQGYFFGRPLPSDGASNVLKIEQQSAMGITIH